MSEDRITIVYTKSGMLLMKKPYAEWRPVQDEIDDYVTSLGPFLPDEFVEFLGGEYPADPPFDARAIEDFLESDRVELWSGPSTSGSAVAPGAVRRFEDAAVEWAGTGYGKPLVDAAVAALIAGLDDPFVGRIEVDKPSRRAWFRSRNRRAATTRSP